MDTLTELWDVVEKPRTAPSYDFLWSTTAEEGREKQFARDPFVLGGNELPADLEGYDYEKIYTADAALKVTRLFLNFEFADKGAARWLWLRPAMSMMPTVHLDCSRAWATRLYRPPYTSCRIARLSP